MKKYISKARFCLEIIALPIFVYLVIHLSGHGLTLLIDEDHDHSHGVHESIEMIDEDHEGEHEDDESAVHAEEDSHESEVAGNFIDSIFTVEVLSGILMLLLFAWIWNRPFMRKFVPCSHSLTSCKCEHSSDWPHILATSAFVLHLFPEAGVRHVLLDSLSTGQALTIVGAIAFIAHFLVDIIIALALSSYWNKKGFVLSMVSIFTLWFAAFYFGEHITEFLPEVAEGVLFLVSGFLLAMFVHKPHRG